MPRPRWILCFVLALAGLALAAAGARSLVKVKEPPRGRVVLANNPARGVPRVEVRGYPEEVTGGLFSATTDETGGFDPRRLPGPMVVGAFRRDDRLGAIARVETPDQAIELALAPTATIRGVLIDDETGKPAANRDVEAHIRVENKIDGGSTFLYAFPCTGSTDADGRFELTGLVPGHEYEIAVVTRRDPYGGAMGWRHVGKTTPQRAEDVDVGELRLPAQYKPPTFEEYLAEAYASTTKLGAEKRLAQALADAGHAYQQVLVVAADPESDAAKQFFRLRFDGIYEFVAEKRFPVQQVLYEFQVMPVDPQGVGDFFADHEVTPPKEGDATLAILNPDGAVAAQAAVTNFMTAGKLDPARLEEFLKSRQNPLPNARRLLDDALAEAARTDKRVLVQVGGPGCGWCVVLSRYLTAHKDAIDKDYVSLKIDSRMPAAEEVVTALRKNETGGVPWMAILDADGRTLITSDGPDGNIGYPSDKKGRIHFKIMLRETRKRLTDADVAALIAALTKDEPK